MNTFNSLLAQLVKYDVHTTRKINSIHAIFYHILSFSLLPTFTANVSFFCLPYDLYVFGVTLNLAQSINWHIALLLLTVNHIAFTSSYTYDLDL